MSAPPEQAQPGTKQPHVSTHFESSLHRRGQQRKGGVQPTCEAGSGGERAAGVLSRWNAKLQTGPTPGVLTAIVSVAHQASLVAGFCSMFLHCRAQPTSNCSICRPAIQTNVPQGVRLIVLPYASIIEGSWNALLVRCVPADRQEPTGCSKGGAARAQREALRAPGRSSWAPASRAMREHRPCKLHGTRAPSVAGCTMTRAAVSKRGG